MFRTSLVVAMVAMARGPADLVGPELPAPQVKEGVEFRVHSVGMSVELEATSDGTRVDREISVMGAFTFGRGGLVVEPMEFLRITDGDGRDVLAGAQRGVMEPRTRRELASSLGWVEGASPQPMYARGRAWSLPRMPSQIGEIRLRAAAVYASEMTRHRVKADVMKEPADLGMGATFLISRVDEKDRYVRVSLEVHLPRDAAKEAPIDAPVIAQIKAISADGQGLFVITHPPEVTTRGEYLVSIEDWTIDRENWARATELEVTMLSGLKRVEFEAELKEVVLVD